MKFKETYREIIDDLKPSEELTNKILMKPEGKNMRLNKSKIIAAAAVACMVIGTTAFAAGRIATLRSWSSPENVISDFSEAEAKSIELGSELSIPEAFSNGYAFDYANTKGVEGLDSDGNKVAGGTDFTAAYVKDDMPVINMFIGEVYDSDDQSYAAGSKMIGGIEVYYNQATYKFVPEGYELTDEDKINMEDPHFELSYGTEQVEIMHYTGISFEKNGKSYSMFAWDSEMSADEWYEMASEWIDMN